MSVGKRVVSNAMKNRDSSSAEKVITRAINIVNTKDMKVRCFVSVWVFIVLILAMRDIGTSQHLSMIRGVDKGSVASFIDKWCHVEVWCGVRSLRLIMEMISDFAIEVGHINLIGEIQIIVNADNEVSRMYIINLVNYSAQSSPPCVHSNISPIVRIIRNRMVNMTGFCGLKVRILMGSGNNRAISRSNSRNRMATRKNRKENGIRADFRGSNPHS